MALPLNAQELPAGFGWFRNVVGYCWVGLLPDGTTEHTHCYTSQFGRFIRGTSTLVQTKGGNKVTAFEGDSLFAWDDKERRIAYYIWASDGSHRQLNAELSGDEFTVPYRRVPREGQLSEENYFAAGSRFLARSCAMMMSA